MNKVLGKSIVIAVMLTTIYVSHRLVKTSQEQSGQASAKNVSTEFVPLRGGTYVTLRDAARKDGARRYGVARMQYIFADRTIDVSFENTQESTGLLVESHHQTKQALLFEIGENDTARFTSIQDRGRDAEIRTVVDSLLARIAP